MTQAKPIGLSEPPTSKPITGWRPFGLGFRPFFMMAGFAAAALVLIWLLSWHSAPSSASSYYGHITWHAHEMLFGYVVAIIAGFLLTAARNWTGVATPSGTPLALLTLLWLGGRLAPWFSAVPHWFVALADTAFLPVLATVLAPVLWPGKNRANRWFLAILLAMAFANSLVHAEALGFTAGTAQTGTVVMLDLIILLLIFVGGRIMPFFTEMAIKGFKATTRKPVETAGFVLIPLLAVLHLTPSTPNWLTGSLLLAISVIQVIRLIGWYHDRIWSIPILWVLHTGYLWLVVGLFLYGVSEFGLFQRSPALHALTIGGIGVFTLGMMARVSLGHTGRIMQSTTMINIAFVMLHIAALVRVFGPVGIPSWYVSWVMLAGIIWVLAFVLFLIIYAPMLIRPRADGRPD